MQDIAAALDVDLGQVERAIEVLDTEYQDRGIRLQRRRDQVQLVSAPEAGPMIERFLGLEKSGRLSVAALETLGIVAYRQPVTRMHIEAIRGVRSDGVLRSLVRRGLIEPLGRASTVGRPILFGTTFEFLEQFGLGTVGDLPNWEELAEDSENSVSSRPTAE
jgi:segregation and condensation protein B